jgi:hypothetical protein
VQYLLEKPRALRTALWVKRRLELLAWTLKGKGQPTPHLVKQGIIRSYRRKYDLEVLVETGTYLGEMVGAMLDEFSSITSIELDQKLFEMAVRRFASQGQVTILQGDSATVMPRLIGQLSTRTLFWLDGHYSGGITAHGAKGSPILEELQAVLGSMRVPYVILVDDARLFGLDPGYPARREVDVLVQRLQPCARIAVSDDVIQIVVLEPVTPPAPTS